VAELPGGIFLIAWLAKVNWKHGIKTTVAACLCLVLGRVFRLPQGYWACVSAVVVLQSTVRDTWTVSRDRIVGTAIGAVIGWGAGSVWHGNPLIYAFAILLCMTVPQIMQLKNAGRMAGVAATIIMLIPSHLPYWQVAVSRFLEVSIGVLVALAVSRTLWRESSAP
jgi:uncharacterized membrane protein YccC